ncbi:hypothetical protein EON67_05280, partial [archaeon]
MCECACVRVCVRASARGAGIALAQRACGECAAPRCHFPPTFRVPSQGADVRVELENVPDDVFGIDVYVDGVAVEGCVESIAALSPVRCEAVLLIPPGFGVDHTLAVYNKHLQLISKPVHYVYTPPVIDSISAVGMSAGNVLICGSSLGGGPAEEAPLPAVWINGVRAANVSVREPHTQLTCDVPMGAEDLHFVVELDAQRSDVYTLTRAVPRVTSVSPSLVHLPLPAGGARLTLHGVNFPHAGNLRVALTDHELTLRDVHVVPEGTSLTCTLPHDAPCSFADGVLTSVCVFADGIPIADSQTITFMDAARAAAAAAAAATMASEGGTTPAVPDTGNGGMKRRASAGSNKPGGVTPGASAPRSMRASLVSSPLARTFTVGAASPASSSAGAAGAAGNVHSVDAGLSLASVGDLEQQSARVASALARVNSAMSGLSNGAVAPGSASSTSTPAGTVPPPRSRAGSADSSTTAGASSGAQSSDGATLTTVAATSPAAGTHGQPSSTSDAHGSSKWFPDTPACQACGNDFTWARRRHHCRVCGACVCADCSPMRAKLNPSKPPARICKGCNARVGVVRQMADTLIAVHKLRANVPPIMFDI